MTLIDHVTHGNFRLGGSMYRAMRIGQEGFQITGPQMYWGEE